MDFGKIFSLGVLTALKKNSSTSQDITPAPETPALNSGIELVVYLKKQPKESELPASMKLQHKHFVD